MPSNLCNKLYNPISCGETPILYYAETTPQTHNARTVASPASEPTNFLIQYAGGQTP